MIIIGIKHSSITIIDDSIFKNKKIKSSIESTVENASKDIPKTFIGVKETTVNMFLRNLPKGWKASAHKIQEAEAFGIALKDGQTIVDSFPGKYRVA